MRPGTKPQGKVKIKWSQAFAYAIGLLVADGCLYKDRRHINFVSKDKVQVALFIQCLGLSNKIGKKYSSNGNKAYQVQFGDVLFYKFLENIGLSPAKSKTIETIVVPDKYFFDFLRGYFDGDGSSYSYYDPVFKNSYRFYISFTSASPIFFDWLRKELRAKLKIHGSISRNRYHSYVQLKYAKTEAVILSKRMYRNKKKLYLQRKYLKVKDSLDIIS